MRYFILFISIFLISGNSFSLDWSAGILETKNNNPEILASSKLVQSALYQLHSAQNGFLPKLSASAGTSYGTNNTNIDPLKTHSLSITANENIFSGFSDTAKVDQAKYYLTGLEENHKSVVAKISFDYKSGFMNLLFSQKYILLTNDIIKRRAANLKLVQLRFESGRENIGSLNLSKAYLAQSKYEYLLATNSLVLARSQLGKVLGRNEYENLEVVGNIPVNTLKESKVNFKELVISIPEYLKSVTEENSALAAIELSKSSFYPNINLSQSISRLSNNSGPWKNAWAIGAELSFPLFSGGKDYYTYKSSSELYRSAVLNKRTILDSGIVKLQDSYSKFLEAIAKVDVDTAFVAAGTSRERIAKEKYNNGLLTFDEWDIIENDLINRQKSLVQTERDRVIAEAYWEQVRGIGVLQ